MTTWLIFFFNKGMSRNAPTLKLCMFNFAYCLPNLSVLNVFVENRLAKLIKELLPFLSSQPCQMSSSESQPKKTQAQSRTNFPTAKQQALGCLPRETTAYKPEALEIRWLRTAEFYTLYATIKGLHEPRLFSISVLAFSGDIAKLRVPHGALFSIPKQL